MSIETPIPGGAATLRRVEIEGVAAMQPPATVLVSGFLAGFVVTWLPLLVLIFTQLYGTFFSGENFLPLGQRWANALEENRRLGASMLAVIAPSSVAVGVCGLALGWLRRLSALQDRYLVIPTREGEVRWGIDALVCIIGIPLACLAFIALRGMGQAILFSFFLILISGFVFHLLWRRFDDLFLRLLGRPRPETIRAGGLQVLLVTVLGPERCRVARVQVAPGEREVILTAEIADEETEKEVRGLIRQYVRGVQVIKIERPG
ncbi:MAG TPA: hypothetical protein VF234_08720 [Limnochordia bacterium]